MSGSAPPTDDIQAAQVAWAALQASQSQPGAPGWDTSLWGTGQFDATTPTASNTGGYVVPTLSSTVEDQALLRLVQQAVAGISGLPSQNVRPRFQSIPIPQPGRNINWAAIGIRTRDNIDYPVIFHNPYAYNGQGGDILIFQESMTFLISFYGPSAEGYSTLFRDGCYIPQNWEILKQSGFNLFSVKHSVNTTELQNKQYVPRADILFLVRREVRRLYPVYNYVQAAGTIVANIDSVNTAILTTPSLPLNLIPASATLKQELSEG